MRNRNCTGALLLTAACAAAPALAQPTVGLFLDTEQASEGYTLWNPRYDTTYLIDNQGRLVNQWETDFEPGNTSYLLPNGHLLRTAKDGPANPIRFTAGGFGGRVEEFAWDGTLIWSYLYSDNVKRQHHDIRPLPNGNVLMIAWELKTSAEAIQEGRNPALLTQGELWPDHIIEVEPVGATGGNIVWEWHIWDHLIQDFDATKDNFGVVADHPELMDINVVSNGAANWMHTNAIDYNAELDQILIGSPFVSEIYVIDHSTTTAEAAGHTGGNSGKGGDFLYRWGNPQNYDRGTAGDATLFGQHDSQWIKPGLQGAGNMMAFNNRAGGNYSTVDEWAPPVDEDGNYTLAAGQDYGPDSLVWRYTHDPPTDLFSGGLSSAQRMPNGNTLICEGRSPIVNFAANFFEVTDAGVVVWRYVNPVGTSGPIAQGMTPNDTHNTFRANRYPPDHPAFIGKDLTPGDPIETFNRPIPVPTTLTAQRLTLSGDQVRVNWDATSCPSLDYNLIYGDLADVATHALAGSRCAIGTSGTYDWIGAPAGSQFLLVVGVDDTGVYESSWGKQSSGAERNGAAPSTECAVTTKITTETCP